MCAVPLNARYADLCLVLRGGFRVAAPQGTYFGGARSRRGNAEFYMQGEDSSWPRKSSTKPISGNTKGNVVSLSAYRASRANQTQRLAA